MGTSKRVLVIEDEQSLAGLIKAMLSRLGHEAVTTMTGNDGLRALNRFNQALDLIIIDYSLPDLTCREIIQQIRALLPSGKVLLTSGYPLDSLKDIDRQTINGFLAKPFNFTQMKATITTLFAA